MSEPMLLPELMLPELISELMLLSVACGMEVSVIGVPLGAETAGSLIELSGRGRAFATPERRPKEAATKSVAI
jgi:hypothetical protein